MKFIMLLNVIMPTIVSISTFISMINATSKRSLKAAEVFIFQHSNFYEQLEIHAQALRLTRWVVK